MLAEKQLVKTSLFVEDGTVFDFTFDFTSAEQKGILAYLQANGYSLFAYKGASGAGQVTAGAPTWFVEPYTSMFGFVTVEYEPLYKVYVFNQAVIAPYTTIKMQALSIEVPLGTALTFLPDGSFTVTGDASPGIITVFNNRDASTPDVTIGLAAYINGDYSPFCAFTCPPQNSVSMEPNEKVVLFAAKANMTSGSVVANTTAPGCTFEFNASSVDYALQMIPGTFGITNAPMGLPVTETTGYDNLLQLLG